MKLSTLIALSAIRLYAVCIRLKLMDAF